MSSATIGSLNVTINGDLNVLHDSLFSEQRIHVLPHNFLLLFYVKKKINMPRNVNFLWCSNQVTGPYIFLVIDYLLVTICQFTTF